MDVDVLVVGGGLSGCLVALMLAREGRAVLVLEKDALSGKASGANAGSIHLQVPYAEFVSLGEDWARGFASVIPMLQDSVALWHALATELPTDIELSVKGGIIVARTETQMARIARKVAIERSAGLAVELLDARSLAAAAPYVSEAMIGGAICPAEGKANPLRTGPAIAAAARAAGARLSEGCALLALERDGAAWRASTTAGPVRAGAVVNAAGADAARVAALAGLDIAIEGFPIQATVTEPVAPLVPHLLYSAAGKLTLKQMGNGALVVGGGWPSRRRADGGLAVAAGSWSANMAAAAEAVPAVARARAVRSWPAIVNGTADWKPLVGAAPGVPDFYLALFPWMGFTGAPITARIVTELVLGRTAPVPDGLLVGA